VQDRRLEHVFSGTRFVIRAGQLDRTVQTDQGERKLREVLDELSPQTWREIEVYERKYPPVNVCYSATTFALRSANGSPRAWRMQRSSTRKPTMGTK
jgi:hypothetical protein